MATIRKRIERLEAWLKTIKPPGYNTLENWKKARAQGLDFDPTTGEGVTREILRSRCPERARVLDQVEETIKIFEEAQNEPTS